MKKKAMIMAVASLGSMALIGTGFAGWVISANTQATAGGLMTAFDVADHRLSVVNGTWEKTGVEQGAVKFGKDGMTTNSTPWFTFNGDDTAQLKDVYTFTVKSNQNGDVGTFTVEQKAGEEGFKVTESAWQRAIDMDLVLAPTVTFDKTSYTLDGTTGVEVKMTVEFKWGAHFENKNPYVFYNDIDANGSGNVGTEKRPTDKKDESKYTWADDAVYCLRELEKVNNATFTIAADVTRTLN